MTAPAAAPAALPVHVTAEDGSRFYLRTNPDTGVEEHYWSVTTALSVKNKDGLKWWSAKLAARRAMANLPMLVRSQLVEACGRTWARTEPLRCEKCAECVQRWVELFHVGESERRKHEGSAIHDAVESWIKTGEWRTPVDLAQPYLERHPDIVKMLPPYLERCRQWVEEYGLRPEDFWASEMTVYHHGHKYAGTCDGALWLSPRTKKAAQLMARILGRLPLPDERILVIIDCKTREGEDTEIYDDHPLQLTAYRNAQTCRPSKVHDREFPMPATHGAVIFQPRPDGYAFRPVRTGPGEFKAFLAFLDGWRWTVEDGATSTQVGTFPMPAGFEWPLPQPEPEPAADAPLPTKKATAKRTRKKAAAPAAQVTPEGHTISGATPPRMAGATLDSLHGGRPPHPDSPYGDNIPF
ncbi:MAG TPA: hypothetical protein VF516_43960 [Kofleriaceae bacterium]